jgi:hypothetical protein
MRVLMVSAYGEIMRFAPTTREIFVVNPNGVNPKLCKTKQ